MVFIIPGMESAAPERTLTSMGSAGSPKVFWPKVFSIWATAASICGAASSGSFLSFS